MVMMVYACCSDGTLRACVHPSMFTHQGQGGQEQLANVSGNTNLALLAVLHGMPVMYSTLGFHVCQACLRIKN
jgi:hypothetical protein